MKGEDHDELRIALEAAMWLMRLETDGPACHPLCSAWLLESSRHVKAFLKVSAMSSRLKGLDPQREIDVDALISQANDSVVSLPSEHIHSEAYREDCRPPQKSKLRKRWPLAGAIALLAGVSVGLFWARVPITRGAETYATEIGQQLKVKLRDGSFVYLNTNSQVQVRYTQTAREAQLLKGEALFIVEHDTARPFQVSAGTAVVRAVGTEFDVYQQPARTLIEVVKGDVLLESKGDSAPSKQDHSIPGPPLSAAPAAVRLTAGERATIDHGGQIRRDAEPNVQLAGDWQQWRLVFDAAPLDQVAAEFNRYNRAQIIVEGETLRSRPVSGIFSANRPQALLRFLQMKDERVIVDTQSEEFIIRFRPRDPS